MPLPSFLQDEPIPYWYISEPNEMRDRDAAKRAERRAAKVTERIARFQELKDKGNDAFKNGDYLAAIEHYRAAVSAMGDHRPKSSLPALLNMIQAFLKLDRPEAAEDMATFALSIDPKNIKARYRRGLARKAQNLLYAATLDFETVLRVDPNCKEAANELESTLDKWEKGEGEETGFNDSEDESPSPSDSGESDDDDDHSDSEDWNHIGNGTPCRYYNQSRCKHGRDCRFSHGPDERAFRDNLGRNVCINFLLGQCKYGLDRCYFSHSTTYLPAETKDDKPYKWWDDEEFLLDARAARREINNHLQHVAGVLGRGGARSGARGRGRGRGRGGRNGGSRGGKRWERELAEREHNYGFTDSDVEELLCQGVKPWDDDAWDVLDALSSY